MRTTISRLDECLQNWEDDCWIVNTMIRYNRKCGDLTLQPEGAVKNYPHLRKILLSVHAPDFSWGYDDFKFPTYGMLDEESAGVTTAVPAVMMDWNLNSRRMYAISEVLMGQLLTTSLRQRTWEDILLPFPCFLIQLPQQLKGPDGLGFSLIFVRIRPQGTRENFSYSIELLGLGPNQQKRISPDKKRKVEKMIDRNHFEQAGRVLDDLKRNSGNNGLSLSRIPSEHLSVAVEETSQRMNPHASQDLLDYWKSVFRIVLGFCLYLRSMPNVSPPVKVWVAPPVRSGIPDSNAVTKPSEVFTVDSYHEFDPIEREELVRIVRVGGGQYEQRSNWVEGHTRRPPGLGHDPNAPKIVVVQPYMRRKDRLLPNSLPGGAEKSA